MLAKTSVTRVRRFLRFSKFKYITVISAFPPHPLTTTNTVGKQKMSLTFLLIPPTDDNGKNCFYHIVQT